MIIYTTIEELNQELINELTERGIYYDVYSESTLLPDSGPGLLHHRLWEETTDGE